MEILQSQITNKLQNAIFNKNSQKEKNKYLQRLYTVFKIYCPKFIDGQYFYYFETQEDLSNRNIDSDTEEEVLVTQNIKVKLLQVNLVRKVLEVVENPTFDQTKKMEMIIDNLYKRIPLYLELQKVKKLHFSKLIDNHFDSRLHFLTSREVLDFEGHGLVYVDKFRQNMIKGKAKLFSEP